MKKRILTPLGILRLLNRRLAELDLFSKDIDTWETALELPLRDAIDNFLSGGDVLTKEVHLLASLHLIQFHISEACLIMEDYRRYARSRRTYREIDGRLVQALENVTKFVRQHGESA